MTGTSKFENKELEFRKELRRRLSILKKKFKPNKDEDGRRGYYLSGTWEELLKL